MSSDRFEELMAEAEDEIGKAQEELQRKRQAFYQTLKSLSFTNYDHSKMKVFLSEPYAVVPKGNDEWYVVMPRFVDLQVGWLERQTATYNIFRVNRYTEWLTGLPKAIREALDFEPKPKVTIIGEHMFTPPKYQEEFFKKYNRFLRMREGRNKIRIRPRMHFNLVSCLIRDGILPFVPQPVDQTDVIHRPIKIELRDYQQEALEKFLKCGNVGVFWMPSAGKTIIGLCVMNMLKGKKLIVVPSLTLMEQWQSRIRELTQIPPFEYRLITYNSAHKVMKDEFILTIYDECHHLPANVFSRLALIKTKYRLGLSATPYREDGRHELIFALTGFPVGLDWKHLMDLRVVRKPRVKLLLVRNVTSKIATVDELVRKEKQKKTIIFCDTVQLGKQLAKRYGVQFIYGQTKGRLNKIMSAPLIVVSRVGDEGISLQRLERVIEFDFLFGSRRQELQRLGRLFHSTFTGEHFILMTEDEYLRYKKRLFSIYEKGIDVTIEEK